MEILPDTSEKVRPRISPRPDHAGRSDYPHHVVNKRAANRIARDRLSQERNFCDVAQYLPRTDICTWVAFRPLTWPWHPKFFDFFLTLNASKNLQLGDGITFAG
jgi:hypothetical protein